jgi:hypothetical protein
VWFVFIAENIFPLDRTRPADLEVRRFDDESHSWDVISKVTALPPPRAGQVVVLNGYVAYLSYQNSDESESLTILDTRDLEEVQQIADVPPVATNSQNMLGLLGVRGSSTDPLASGGTLNLMLEDCSASSCPLAIQPVFVGSAVTTGSLVSIGAYEGTPAFAQALTERHSFIAMHSTAASQVHLYDVDPFDIDQFDDTPLPSVSTTLNGLALFECENAVVVSEGDENRLRGVSLAGGSSAPFDLGREAQGLWFEPFTQVLIAPYNSDVDLPDPTEDNAGSIDAVSVTGQGVSAPLIELLAADDWSPPDDLRVLTAAVRIPPTFSCE